MKKIGNWLEDKFLKLILKLALKRVDDMKGSWKTTVYGALGALTLIFSQIMYVIDGDPATVFSLEVFIAQVVGFIALFKAHQEARDKGVSTEQEKAAAAAAGKILAILVIICVVCAAKAARATIIYI